MLCYSRSKRLESSSWEMLKWHDSNFAPTFFFSFLLDIFRTFLVQIVQIYSVFSWLAEQTISYFAFHLFSRVNCSMSWKGLLLVSTQNIIILMDSQGCFVSHIPSATLITFNKQIMFALALLMTMIEEIHYRKSSLYQ